ncbi:MAG: hypothetical protein ACXQTP_06195 [Candidatus Methanofastidiosia archaeon]
MKKYLAILLSLLVFGCIMGDSGGNVAEKDGFKIFMNKSEGFSFTYPADWEEDVKDQIFHAPGGFPAVGIKESFVEPKNKNEDVQDVISNFENDQHYNIVLKTKYFDEGKEFEKLDMEYLGEERVLYSVLFISVNGEHLYQILYLGRDKKEVEQAIETTMANFEYI